MDGNQSRHVFYRQQICDFMRYNRTDFEPFIVDQPFDSFLRSLSKDGTYGGNECLVAFSRLYDARICIHQVSRRSKSNNFTIDLFIVLQLNQPVWTVCFSDSPKHEIHISYHNYEHYSSVRKLGDHSSASANIRQMLTTCDPSTLNKKPKKSVGDSASAIDDLFTEHDIDYIESQLTSPVDRQLIRDTLTDNQGDFDLTIASLLAFEQSVVESFHPHVDQSVETIMSITGINDVELIQQVLSENNQEIQTSVTALTDLNLENNETNDDDNDGAEEKQDQKPQANPSEKKNPTKNNRQTRIDKKKAKKQRATEKHRAQILAASQTAAESTVSKKSEDERPEPNVVVTADNQPVPIGNLEFIRI